MLLSGFSLGPRVLDQCGGWMWGNEESEHKKWRECKRMRKINPRKRISPWVTAHNRPINKPNVWAQNIFIHVYARNNPRQAKFEIQSRGQAFVTTHRLWLNEKDLKPCPLWLGEPKQTFHWNHFRVMIIFDHLDVKRLHERFRSIRITLIGIIKRIEMLKCLTLRQLYS